MERLNAAATVEASKIDLAPWGFAPGDYIFTCRDCTQEYPLDDLHFGHRHATRCAKHALGARLSYIRTLEGVLTADSDQELADEALALIKTVSDRWIRRAFIGSLILAPIMIGFVIWFHPG